MSGGDARHRLRALHFAREHAENCHEAMRNLRVTNAGPEVLNLAALTAIAAELRAARFAREARGLHRTQAERELGSSDG